ncbi:MAG: methyltransferase domain-containing protein [Legionellaceae bacterium]|nr:methyltransferase domain-containing protein [Legionellaceae bacterium]
MARIKKKPTDWESYYQKPSFFAKFTRKTTERILLDALKEQHAREPIQTICELGGGNSCFFTAIRQEFPEVHYTIVDNNQLSVDLFREKNIQDKRVSAEVEDALVWQETAQKFDVVFSVGLIEHFSAYDTSCLIRNHFLISKKGGLVMMTFPTPTWLYKTIRFCSEQLNQWIFHDERPLELDEVTSEVSQYAHIIRRFINWRTVLTQGVVIGTGFTM